ncbi:MAG: ribosomal protein S18-alanine N-acetyltransferase [Tissierellia bacterium]|nr:ribosomal protein S18-alanine N-acetyltransferase [Tissierellia bacterium]
MDIRVREMKEDDVDQVVEIEREAFTTPWSREAFMAEVNKNKLAKYMVAEVDGRVVGFGGMWLILNEAHITNIAVKEEYRGMGVGKRILESLIYYCALKNIDSMTLEVRKSNMVAQKLYRKYGFVEYGVRSNYYTDNGEDAIVMWRTNILR